MYGRFLGRRTLLVAPRRVSPFFYFLILSKTLMGGVGHVHIFQGNVTGVQMTHQTRCWVFASKYRFPCFLQVTLDGVCLFFSRGAENGSQTLHVCFLRLNESGSANIRSTVGRGRGSAVGYIFRVAHES